MKNQCPKLLSVLDTLENPPLSSRQILSSLNQADFSSRRSLQMKTSKCPLNK